MARNDGIDRTIARNVNLTASKIANAQRHNEREKESYTNPDIVPERLPYNIHYKSPTGSYSEMFEKMKSDGIISTRGLKDDAKIYGELIFDVNSAYFYNHGGYEFAKQFYDDAYKAAVEIIGGEQYILFVVNTDEIMAHNCPFTRILVRDTDEKQILGRYVAVDSVGDDCLFHYRKYVKDINITGPACLYYERQGNVMFYHNNPYFEITAVSDDDIFLGRSCLPF